MKTQVRLNAYERGIVEELINHFHYKSDAARKLVVQYVPVIRKLGGYDSCLDHAERILQASQAGYKPKVWLKRIHAIENGASKDPGIPHLERRPYVTAR